MSKSHGAPSKSSDGDGSSSSSRPKRNVAPTHKTVDVIFHGLRHNHGVEKIAKATVPVEFMEDKVDMKSSLMAQYRDLKRQDNYNWGSRNINMQELGYVGELCLNNKDDNLYYGPAEAAQRRGSNSTSYVPHNMPITNSREYWAWFNTQRHFESNVELANGFDLQKLIYSDLKGNPSSSQGAVSGLKRARTRYVDQATDSYFLDLNETPRDTKGNCVIETNHEFAVKKRNTRQGEAAAGSLPPLEDSKLYERLSSCILLSYGFDSVKSDSGSGTATATANGSGDGSGDGVKTKKVGTSSTPRGGNRKQGGGRTSLRAQARAQAQAQTSENSSTAKEVVNLTGVPLERRTILELGALGILRDGDNAGDWTTFCREMRRTSVDTEVDAMVRDKLEAERVLELELQRLVGKVRKRYVDSLSEERGLEENAADRATVALFRKKLGGGEARPRRKK